MLLFIPYRYVTRRNESVGILGTINNPCFQCDSYDTIQTELIGLYQIVA